MSVHLRLRERLLGLFERSLAKPDWQADNRTSAIDHDIPDGRGRAKRRSFGEIRP